MITPEQAKAELDRRRSQGGSTTATQITPEQARAELARRQEVKYNTYDTSAKNAFGIADAGFDVGVGVLKGFGSTLSTPLVKGAEVGQAIQKNVLASKSLSGVNQMTDIESRLNQRYSELPDNDPRKAQVAQAIKDIQSDRAKVTGMAEQTVNAPEVNKDFKPDLLKPKGTAQKIGYGAEQLAEFFVPAGLAKQGVKILDTAVDAQKYGKVASTALKTAGRSGIGAAEGALVTAAQGGTPEQIKTNAQFGAAIPVAGAALSGLRNVAGKGLQAAARPLYRSAAKFGGTADDVKNLVETGLKEGVNLTEGGIEKTISKIDNLEGQLGKAIESSAAKGAYVETRSLKPYIDDVKSMFGETLDVFKSKQYVKELDSIYTNLRKKYGARIPIKEAQTLKTNTYNLLRKSYGELSGARTEGLKQATRGLKEGILKKAPKTGNINSRLANLYKFDTALEKSTKRIGNLNLVSLGTKALASSGSMVGNTLAIINQLVGPKGKSVTATTLYKLGEMLKANKSTTAIGQVIFGKGNAEKLTPQEQVIANKISSYLKNPRLGNSIEDVSGAAKKGNPAVGETADLASQARNYKTAEEFVKAKQGNVVYHGSPTPLKKFSNKKGGAFFTDSMEDASGFAGSPDNVYEGYVDFKKPLVIDAKGAKWNELNTKYGKSTQEVISNAQKDGYDGITFKNIVDNVADTADVGGESTIHYAYKPEDSFINESQLTDIWNKGQVADTFQKSNFASLDDMMKGAPAAKTHIDTTARRIAQETGNTFADAKVKSIDSVNRKLLEKDIAGDHNNINDIARNTIVLNKPKTYKTIVDSVKKEYPSSKVKVQTPEKYMGYSGTIINVKTPKGFNSEIQIVTPKMMFGKLPEIEARRILKDSVVNRIAKETGLKPGVGHDLYEEFIKAKRNEKLLLQEQIEEKSIDYYSKLR